MLKTMTLKNNLVLNKKKKMNLREKFQIGVMILPAIIIYTLFLITPIIMAFHFSLHTWNGISGSPLNFVGFDNFTRVLSDSTFHLALKNLVSMVFFSVIFHTPIALILAVALHSKMRMKRFFKAIYFIPTIFPLTAIGLLWYFILMPNGSLNAMLEGIGLGDLATGWLINPSTAMPAIIFVNIWAGIGYFMVIILAGLKGIPNSLYEAAAIDGANKLQSFFKITIPVLMPVLGLCVLLDLIGTIKIFDLVFSMTGGGPNGLTQVPTTLIYFQSLRFNNHGFGSAIGIILLFIVLIAIFIGKVTPIVVKKVFRIGD